MSYGSQSVILIIMSVTIFMVLSS